jgi:hypothetical protein
MILDLRECFHHTPGGTSTGSFFKFLASSDHPEIVKAKKQTQEMSSFTNNFKHLFKTPILDKCKEIEESVLNQILDTLLIETEADYFWYDYPEHGNELSYSLPEHDTVPGDALRVDKEKIKSFLRNWKLEKLGI